MKILKYFFVLFFINIFYDYTYATDIIELQPKGQYKVTTGPNITEENLQYIEGSILKLVDKDENVLKNFVIKFPAKNLDDIRFVSTFLGEDYKPIMRFIHNKSITTIHSTIVFYHAHNFSEQCNLYCKTRYIYKLGVEKIF